MSKVVIRLSDISKMYRIFRSRRHQVLHLMGIPVPECAYDEFWALRDIDLDVSRGSKIGIIGPNGAGKSTLLKIIASQVAPTEGVVEVRGNVQALMELGTGFHPEFTGRENVFSALSYQGIVGREAEARFEEIADFSELDEFINHPVKTYSAGMYARLAFSVATAIEPEILIIDEVLGAGDAYFGAKCVDRMNDLTQRSGATVLFVSHDTSSVLRLCNRVIWMKKGQVIMDGPAHEVVKEYVDSMRFETEVRHRAREMHLNKGHARAIMTTSDVFKKLLFRLKVDGAHPQYDHRIDSVVLKLKDTVLAHVNVGEAMDNNPQEASYVLSDKGAMDWSPPIETEQGLCRYYRNCQGTEQHAPFVLSAPVYLCADEELSLDIRGLFDSRETVHVEMWDDEGQYLRLGRLADSDGGACTIPLRSPQTEDAGAQLKPEETAFLGSTQRAAEDEFSNERVVAIRKVEIRDAAGESKRVFSMGSDISVEVEFEAFREVNDPVFAITFHRIDGIQMDHQNTRLLGERVGKVSGKGTAKFSFSPLRLGPGEYLITLAILKYLDLDNWADQPPSYDRHDRRYTISIFSTVAGGKNLGAVLQDCRFSLR
jgi:lipopolysaccharide transport system ATP-binding protein